MAIREVELNGKMRRLGDASDAGAVCTTTAKPDGVLGSSYRGMVHQLGAPGPIIDESTGYPSLNPATRMQEYDLDAVEHWHLNERPGPGSYWKSIEHRTELRHEVLRAVADGKLTTEITLPAGARGMQVRLVLDGAPYSGRAKTRAFNDLQREDMITLPASGGGRTTITAAGTRLLATWDEQVKSAAGNSSRALRPTG